MRWFGKFRADGTIATLLAILFFSSSASADSGEGGDWGVWLRESVSSSDGQDSRAELHPACHQHRHCTVYPGFTGYRLHALPGK